MGTTERWFTPEGQQTEQLVPQHSTVLNLEGQQGLFLHTQAKMVATSLCEGTWRGVFMFSDAFLFKAVNDT